MNPAAGSVFSDELLLLGKNEPLASPEINLNESASTVKFNILLLETYMEKRKRNFSHFYQSDLRLNYLNKKLCTGKSILPAATAHRNPFV